MKNVILKKEIANRYDTMVRKYLAQGTIFPWQNGASDGTIAKIEIQIKDYVVRVRIENVYGKRFSDNPLDYADCIVITAEKFEISRRSYDSMGGDFWNGHGEELESETYYKIDRHGDAYTDSADEYRKIRDLQSKRWEDKREITEYEVKVDKKVVLNALRNHKGYKSKKADIIKKCVHDVETGKYIAIIAGSYGMRVML